MFGRKQAAATAAIVPAISPQRPQPRLAVVGSEPLGVYEELARELNYKPAQLLEEQLLRFLNENQIEVYDYDEVDRYMAALAEKIGKVWIWRPLREQDKPEGWMWEGRRSDEGGAVNQYRGHGGYRNEFEYRPYPHAVPVHVLRNVKKIQDKFGAQAKFFVSDYADPKPDPFIMVTALDVKRIIFGVWDEPGFGTSN